MSVDLSPPPTSEAEAEPQVGGNAAASKPPVWRRYLGLWLAPLGIIALGFLLYLYYQSLGIGTTAIIQVSSALDWNTKLWPQIQTHLLMAFWSTLLVIVIAVPLGVLLTRPAFRKFSPAVLAVANSGQAIPAYGLLVLFLGIFQPDTKSATTQTVVYALTLYALLPVLRNTMVGLEGVDTSIIEAGRGMGLTRWQALTKIELPLAVPVILAGVRTAMIINIGMATLGFLIGGGGLGITINSGLELSQHSVLIVGAVTVALVALTFDWIGAMAERFLRPRGL
jgi:osmoprotectant transport system permease protein